MAIIPKVKTVLLDAGHGIETAGKRSPVWGNGEQLLEYEYSRQLMFGIAHFLDEEGIPYRIITPDDHDIPLKERCEIINRIVNRDRLSYLLVSIHCNASDGRGTGWEAYTSIGKTTADIFTNIFYEEACKALPHFNIRVDNSDGDPDKEANFYILKNSLCPAILTENLFMDNEKDCKYLLSNEGFEKIVMLHVNAIKRCVDYTPRR